MVYDFSLDYNNIDVLVILSKIHKYLMKNHNIKQCSDL